MSKKKSVTLHVVRNHEYGFNRVMRSDELKDCLDPDGESVDDSIPLSSQLLAQYLDDEAEGENYHDFVGCHAALAKLIAKHASEEVVVKVLTDIVLAGSLRRLC